MTKGRQRLYATIAILLGIGISFLLVETGLRLFGKQSRYFSSGFETPHQDLTVKHSPDAGLYIATPAGRRLRPNTHGIIRDHFLSHIDVDVRTNEFGFRGGAIDWDHHPRVLLLGDSVTLGDYLPEDQTFAVLVKMRSKGWEVLNAGVGSIGIDDELSILKETVDRVKPDKVVLNLYLNDVLPSPAVTLIHPPRFLASLWTVQYLFQGLSLAKYAMTKDRPGTIPDVLWEAWRIEVGNKYFGRPGDYLTSRDAFYLKIQESFRDWGSAWSPHVTRYLLSRVDLISAECRKRNLKFAVVIHPVSYQVQTDYEINEPQRELMRELNKRGTPALDLLPTFRVEYKRRGKPNLFYDQCHHTPEGAAIVAAAIFSFLNAP